MRRPGNEKDWSVCKTARLPATKTERQTVQYHSAVIAGDSKATTVVLHADHRDLVRFSDANDVNYEIVLYYLKKYTDSAPTAVSPKWVTEDDCRSS